MSKFSKAFVGFHLLYLIANGFAFTYKDVGTWGHYSATCAEVKKQSPIDLHANVTQVNRLPIKFINYKAKPKLLKINNSGHSVTFTAKWGKDIPIITGKLVNEQKFRFSELHFHWSKDKFGSEHTIEGQRFAIEAHFVYVNVRYRNMQEALGKVDGILVIGVPFEVKDMQQSSKAMIHLPSLFSTVTKKISAVNSRDFDISSFDINSINSFYTYTGSLTTPPCSENVRWIVSNKPLLIASSILNSFRNIQLDDFDETNARPVQPLNNREVILYQLKKHI